MTKEPNEKEAHKKKLWLIERILFVQEVSWKAHETKASRRKYAAKNRNIRVIVEFIIDNPDCGATYKIYSVPDQQGKPSHLVEFTVPLDRNRTVTLSLHIPDTDMLRDYVNTEPVTNFSEFTKDRPKNNHGAYNKLRKYYLEQTKALKQPNKETEP